LISKGKHNVLDSEKALIEVEFVNAAKGPLPIDEPAQKRHLFPNCSPVLRPGTTNAALSS
jgi:hypothetical protein